MDKNIIYGQAMEDIKAGEAVVFDAETGKFRKAIQPKWQLADDANVTDEKRTEINEYIDMTVNRPIRLQTETIKIIYGSCPKDEYPTD